MSDTMKDITGIFALLVVAGIVTVVLSQNSQTPKVAGAIFSGFSQSLAVAMGGSYSGIGVASNGGG
jgi:hypothetical protein